MVEANVASALCSKRGISQPTSSRSWMSTLLASFLARSQNGEIAFT